MISSFLMAVLYSFEYMYHSSFIKLSVVEHMALFHVLTVMDNHAMNIEAQLSFNLSALIVQQ